MIKTTGIFISCKGNSNKLKTGIDNLFTNKLFIINSKLIVTKKTIDINIVLKGVI